MTGSVNVLTHGILAEHHGETARRRWIVALAAASAASSSLTFNEGAATPARPRYGSRPAIRPTAAPPPASAPAGVTACRASSTRSRAAPAPPGYPHRPAAYRRRCP